MYNMWVRLSVTYRAIVCVLMIKFKTTPMKLAKMQEVGIFAEIRTCSTKAINFLFNLSLLYMTMRTRAMGTMIKIIGAKSNTLVVKSIVACRMGTEEYDLMEQFGGKKTL